MPEGFDGGAGDLVLVLGLLAPLMSCFNRYRGFSLGLYFLFSLTPVRGGTYFFWR
jgi:hypothetical protein